jgi:putative endonuclease
MYYVYITTNPGKTTFYVGVTNNIARRIGEHKMNRGKWETFAGRYSCYQLIYYETFQYINDAIAREKELKLMNRSKKLDLIKTKNPHLGFYQLGLR